jgi:hypothetical protein
MLELIVAYQIVYYNAMIFAKFSYLFFYPRTFVSKEFQIAASVWMGCVYAYWVKSVY